MKLALLDQLLAACRDGNATALATDMASGSQWLVTSDTCHGETALGPAELTEVRTALNQDQSHVIETTSGQSIFVDVWSPRLRLLIVGGVHTAQALVPLARIAGYDVTVIDPRTTFGAPARFPETHLVNDWPQDAVPGLKPDRRTAMVTLTHNPTIDDPALIAALHSDAFFIGALGSRRTHAKRCERLFGAGFSENEIRRIHGPVGLAIGALTPGEIAISIMAQITAVLRKAPTAR